jgi:hypothetical protein
MSNTADMSLKEWVHEKFFARHQYHISLTYEHLRLR